MKNYEYVDTSIGTVGDGQAESFHGGGKTHPGAVVPFGMVQMSPDTVTAGDDGTGYNYCHKTIEGFSINHMSGIGWYGDLGNFQVMPVVGETDLILGKTEDAEYFRARAKRYAENYDSELGYMNTREDDGSFRKVDGRYSTSGCVESNVFQQGWFVPYDVEGLFEVFGKERAVSLLEELFEKADLSALWNEDYNHSNEPCHNLTHYFAAVGLPHRTQYWTRRVQKESYRRGAFGFCGNEDVGQLSAWYVLSAMGFAQICPTKEEFYINTPLFKKITLTLDPVYHGCKVSGTLETVTDKDPNEYPYIKGVKLNGEEITRRYLTYSEITNGGRLEIFLTKASV